MGLLERSYEEVRGKRVPAAPGDGTGRPNAFWVSGIMNLPGGEALPEPGMRDSGRT